MRCEIKGQPSISPTKQEEINQFREWYYQYLHVRWEFGREVQLEEMHSLWKSSKERDDGSPV